MAAHNGCNAEAQRPIIQLSRANVARRSAASLTGIRPETISLVSSEPLGYWHQLVPPYARPD